MNMPDKNALQYIKNTNGGATHGTFVDDHEPIGDMIWNSLYDRELVDINFNGYVVLTEEGEKALAS